MTGPLSPPYADRCPRCVLAVAYPLVVVPSPTRVECLYECVCGFRWATSWDPDEIEGEEAA